MIYTLAPEENELLKDSFYDKLNQIYQRIPAYDTKIIVGHCNAKIGRKEVLKPVTGNWGLHDIQNEYETRAIHFATNDNMIIVSTYFLHRNVHKET